MQRGRDIDLGRLPGARRRAATAATSAMEANEPAFILATSGTTAKPKLAVHTHGGYQVHIVSMGALVLRAEADRRLVGDVRHRLDRRPQLHGLRAAARRLHDGRVRGRARPSRRRTPTGASAVEEFGVTGIFTSPTAVRMLMRYGDEPLARRRSLAGSSASSAPARCSTRRRWDWLQNTVLDGRVPVIDHMWQTETGGPVFGNPYGIGAAADQAGVGGASRCPASRRRSSRSRATPCAPDEKGIMVLKRPFPGLTPALWGEPERYGRDYWEQIPERLLHRRLGARRRGRLRLVRRPRRRDHQDRRRTASARSRSRARS